MIDKQMTGVLVVGAGPTGLTLALDLARSGVSCRVIDQEPEYHVGSRARGLNPPSLELFERLGVLAQLSERTEPFLFTRLYDRNNQVVREINLGAGAAAFALPGTRSAPLKIGQQQVEEVLRAALASYGVQVELNTRLSGFHQDSQGVTAFIERGGQSEQLRASFIAGCDGAHSTVRARADIVFQGTTGEEEFGLVGNASVSGLEPGFHIWTDPARPSGFLLMLDFIRASTWFFTAVLLPDEYAASRSVLENLQDVFDRQIGLPGVQFSNPLWLSTYRPQNLRLAEQYRSGRILLAGDAAHIGMIHGMEAGLADAANLAPKLTAVLAGEPQTLLDVYEAERRPMARRELDAGGFSAGARAIINSLLHTQ